MSYEFNIAGAIDDIAANPLSVQRIVLNAVETASGGGGNVIVSTGNPAGLLIEMAAGLFSYNYLQLDAEMRKLYPELAQEPVDVYRHMADVDYPSVFATPSIGYFNFIFDEREIINKALPVAGQNYRKLTIPCFTNINVAGTTFTMQQPIELRVTNGGTVQPVVDETFYTPLMTISNRDIVTKRVVRKGLTLLVVTVPVQQMEVVSNNVKPTSVTGYVNEFSFMNEFYAARAYVKNTSGQLVEIRTTFSDQVYDVAHPTVQLKLNGKRLRVTIPQIYFNNQTITDNLRIDIYTTKGYLQLNLIDYNVPEFTYNLVGLSTRAVDAYTSPLLTLSTLGINSSTEISAGQSSITFNALRERVINRSAITEGIPIIPNQLKTYLNDAGFDLTIAMDRINERKLLASRSLPPPQTEITSTGISCQIEGFTFKATELEANPNIYQTGNRYTISPKTLFRLDNGLVKLVDSLYVDSLLNSNITTIEQLSTVVNADSFIFSPFHYVVDISNTELSSRAYLLSQPTTNATFFVSDNPTTEVSARTKATLVELTDTGYVITVELDGSSVFKEFTLAQLNFVLGYQVPNSTQRVNVVGQFQGAVDSVTGKPENGRYIYRFTIDLSFDIDRDHNLLLLTSLLRLPLNTVFDLVGVVSNHLPLGTMPTEMDSLYSVTQLNNYDAGAVYIGFMHERIDVTFGTFLNNLWNRSRSVVGELEYELAAQDIPLYYTQDVIELEPDGTPKLYWNAVTEEYETRLLHAQGDPQLDEFGIQRYQYRTGDVIRDATGQPILKNGVRGIRRIVDMLFFDGKYYFATDQLTIDYVARSAALITDWATDSINNLKGELINQTQLFLYPKNLLGALEVLVGNDERAYVQAEQRLKVDFYVSGAVLQNSEVRARLVNETKKAINDAFAMSTVSYQSIIDAIRKRIANDVVSFKISGFLNEKYDTVTLADGSMQFALAKTLVPLSNLTLQVQDFLQVDFLKQG